MAKHKVELDPGLEEELHLRLEEQLDELDDVAEKRKRVNHLLVGHMKVIRERITTTRRQLKGLDLDDLQEELPGVGERPEPAQDPVVQGILELAGGIVAKRGEHEVPPLEWEDDGSDLARAAVEPLGEYRLERTQAGNWTASWSPDEGQQPRHKLLAVDKPKDEAEEACRRHYLDAVADGLLKSTGNPEDEKLAKEPKGPAEKFKPRKGGR